MMVELEKSLNPEAILASQIEAVRAFTPKEIFKKRDRIVETVRYGLDGLASIVKQEAEEIGLSLSKQSLPHWRWSLVDFAQAALSNPPLPPESFEKEEIEKTGVSMEKVEVAEGHNWWNELSEEQKEVLWRILKEDFGLDREATREPIERSGFEGYQVIRSYKLITVPAGEEGPENRFYPALVFTSSGEVYLSCYVLG